jgi:hypothetical protein
MHGQFTTFHHATVFGCDRRLPDPLLYALDCLVMALFDLRPDWLEVRTVGLDKPR